MFEIFKDEIIDELCSKRVKGKIDYSKVRYYYYQLRHNFDEINKDELANRLNTLSYDDYLNTFYWHVIRVRANQFDKYICTVCGNQGSYNVHHKTYEHKGREYDYMQDLTLVCVKCHKEIHFLQEQQQVR